MSQIERAIDLIPGLYAELPTLRLFLPFFDDDGQPQRWSNFLVEGVTLTGSIEWSEIWNRHSAIEGESVTGPTPARGRLDHLTARALTDALTLLTPSDTVLHCLQWEGYAAKSLESARQTVHQFGHEFIRSDSTISCMMENATSDRIPEFGYDDSGDLAWGTNIYPDSLIIASEESIYRSLINDPRLDTVTIRKDSDRLPVSSGD